MKARIGLSSVVYAWLALIVLLPIACMVSGAFSGGVPAFFNSLVQPEAMFSLKLTFLITGTVVLLNTVFGTMAAMMIARRSFLLWRWINIIVDLPLAMSPVIAGLALVLIYGPNSFVGGFLQHHGIKVIFAFPGMVLATAFVTFPFLVRELVPILTEIGTLEEEAAYTLGASGWKTFWTVTLPHLRFGIIYGMILTISRSLGEFGAVLVVSGSVIMLTQTATQFVYQATVDSNMQSAYSVSVVLAATSFVILIMQQVVRKMGAKPS